MLIGWYVLGSETIIGSHPGRIFNDSVGRCKATTLYSNIILPIYNWTGFSLSANKKIYVQICVCYIYIYIYIYMFVYACILVKFIRMHWGGGGEWYVCAPPPPPLLTQHFYFPLELYVYITLTKNYLAFFIYQLIILWTISINWYRWLLLNNHTSKYNSFILVLYRRYINYVSVCPPPFFWHLPTPLMCIA